MSAADAMPAPNPAAFEFLQTRRSRPSKTLTTPVPDRATIMELLTVAARTPDHGKLEPWRFIVLERAALVRLADALPARAAALGIEPDKLAKADMGRARILDVQVPGGFP